MSDDGLDMSHCITYAHALRLPFKIVPLYTILWVLNQLLCLVLVPANIFVTAYFIDTAFSIAKDNWQGGSRIIPPLILLTAFQIYNYLLGPLMALMNAWSELKIMRIVRVPLLEKRSRLSYKHLENSETLDLLTRVWKSPEKQLSGMLVTVVSFLVLLGTLLSYVVILLTYASLSGLILLVLSTPILFFSIKFGQAIYQAERETTERSRFHWTINYYLTGRELVNERKLFGYTDIFSNKYMESFESVRKWQLNVYGKWYARSKGASIVWVVLSVAAFFILIPNVTNGILSVGLYISLIRALITVINSLSEGLPKLFQQFSVQKEFLKDFNCFLSLSEEPDSEALPAYPCPAFESIEFKNVSFAYPGTTKLILDHLSFKIEKGKHYAFVGLNGAGKTTVTKLIIRLYDEYEGEILLNGKSIRDYSLKETKSIFFILFQDFARYDITVAENVAIGKINGADEEEIDQALKMSGFEINAKKLNKGKHTLLGKIHESSIDLSGGEWQRLALARAIISPSAVKIFDEPTASLDPMAESELYAQFEEISRGTTTIFISHRLASARMADCVFVLDGGKLIESGNHDELMKAEGLYAEMFENQKSWYM